MIGKIGVMTQYMKNLTLVQLSKNTVISEKVISIGLCIDNKYCRPKFSHVGWARTEIVHFKYDVTVALRNGFTKNSVSCCLT